MEKVYVAKLPMCVKNAAKIQHQQVAKLCIALIHHTDRKVLVGLPGKQDDDPIECTKH